MKVDVAGVRRSDLVRAIPYLAVRLRANWIKAGGVVAVIFAALVGIRVVENEDITFGWIGVFAVAAGVAGLAATSAGILAKLALVAALANKLGLLEAYTVTLREDGVHTQSDRGEGLLKWAAVAFLLRTRNYLFIGITPRTALIVPVRMFASVQESEAFWVRTCELWRAARTQQA
jgi:hypothetical protein